MFFSLSNSLAHPCSKSTEQALASSVAKIGPYGPIFAPFAFCLDLLFRPPPTWYDSMRTPICCTYFAKRPTSKLTICPQPPHTLKHPGMWAQILNSDCIWSAKRIAFWIISYLAQPFRRMNLYSNKVQSCEAWKI